MHRASFWLLFYVGCAALTALFPLRLTAQQIQPVVQARGVNGIFLQEDFETDESAGPSTAVPSSKRVGKLFAQGKEAAQKGDYGTAIEVLQPGILDSQVQTNENRVVEDSEDYFVDATLQTSLRSQAEDLIGNFPPEGRRAYELQFGIVARQMLEEAAKSHDLAVIEEVARRFFHTTAGYEATYLLATANLDHAQPLAAAVQLERLRKLDEKDRPWEPMLTLKCALAWGRAGVTDKAVKTLRELKQKYPNGRLSLGGRTRPFYERDEDAVDWLVSVLGGKEPARQVVVDEWRMFRGSPSRNAASPPLAAALRVAWKYDTTRGLLQNEPQALEQFRTNLQQLSADGVRGGIPTIPAMQPLVVGNQILLRTFEQAASLDRQTGEPLWQTAINDASLEQQLNIERSLVRENVGGPTPFDTFLRERAWADLTAGTMSTDGEMLFTLEELSSAENENLDGMMRQLPAQTAPSNKLTAFQLASGRLAWEVGGQVALHSLAEAGSYFLGPPLPIAGELYCLVENGAEVRLVVLDAKSGRRKWALSLARAQRGLNMFPDRKSVGISPAFSDGVLICPTSYGTVVGVDLVRRRLLWGHQYASSIPMPFANMRAAVGRGRMIVQGRVFIIGDTDGTSVNSSVNESQRWFDYAPIVAEGRVILTPRDAHDLICLNVLDGSVAWTKPRENGLYVATVFNGSVAVVGRDRVESWRLADGTPVWKEPVSIPVPSGRGCGSGALYHLPLSTGEIATLDLAEGRILAKSKTPDQIQPGNLVAANDAIISQTPDGLVAFRGLSELQRRIDEELERSPGHAGALALRGELRLHLGDDSGGLSDLRAALAASELPRARALIVDTLIEGLRLDFAKYRSSTAELESLIDDPHLMTRFLKLQAAGLAELKEHDGAFTAYLKLATLGGDSSELESMSEGHSVLRGQWASAKMSSIYRAANDVERSRIDPLVGRELTAAVESANPHRLRRFLHLFGELPAADSARLALVSMLDPVHDALELEGQLRDLRTSRDDKLAAEATARLADLLIRNNASGEASELISDLAERWSEVICLDGRTGRDLAEEWLADTRVLASMDDSWTWPDRHFSATTTVRSTSLSPSDTVPIVGARDPRYEGWTLKFDPREGKVTARDAVGADRWTMTIPNDRPISKAGVRGRYAYWRGHCLVLVLGPQFFVCNTLVDSRSPSVLWRGALAYQPRQQYESEDAGPQPLRKSFELQPESTGRVIGSVGPVTEDYICYRTGLSLIAADPLTGETLWERSDVSVASDVFGDREFVFVAEPEASEAIMLRGLDGERVGTCRLPSADSRIRANGRRMLVREFYGIAGKESISVVDIVAGETIWKSRIATSAKLQPIQDDEVAVIDPAGRLTVYALSNGTKVVDAPIDPVINLQGASLLRSRERYVLLTSAFPPQQLSQVVQAGQGAMLVHGPAYGFDRQTGARLWRSVIEHQYVNLDQPMDLPVLVLAVRTLQNSKKAEDFGGSASVLELLDKRTGRLIYRRGGDELLFPFRVAANEIEKTIDVSFGKMVVQLSLNEVPTSTDLPPQTEVRNDDTSTDETSRGKARPSQ